MKESLEGNNAERIREVCRYIELHPEEPLTLAQFASFASMSRFHFARTFRADDGRYPEGVRRGARVRALKAACALREAWMPRFTMPATARRRASTKMRLGGWA